MKYNRIIIYSILSIFLLIITILGYVVFPANRNTDIRKSALLNEKYEDSISKIELTSSSNDDGYRETLILSYDDNLWIGRFQDIEFPVTSKKVTAMLSTFASIRDMELSSKRVSAWENYNLLEKDAIKLRFFAEDGTIYSELYFGTETFNGRKIFCRSGRSESVYSISNDIYPYLSTEIKNWADLSLVPTCVVGTSDMILRQDNISKSALSSATASNIMSASSLDNKSFTLVNIIQADFGDGGYLELNCYKLNNSENYYIQPSFSTHKNKLSYLLEISSWSYSKLFND